MAEDDAPVRRGHVFVISGPSGAGKDAVITRLLAEIPLEQVITATTRRPRPGEIAGKEYRFMTEEEFLAMRDRGDLLEWARVYDNWYGVPADTIRAALADGRNVLVKVDVQGARTIKQTMPDATFIFIRPASIEELRRRVRDRGGETDEELDLRMRIAEREMEEQAWFDAVVENLDGQLDRAVAEVCAIILTILETKNT
jgi:guanylate kinase